MNNLTPAPVRPGMRDTTILPPPPDFDPRPRAAAPVRKNSSSCWLRAQGNLGKELSSLAAAAPTVRPGSR